MKTADQSETARDQELEREEQRRWARELDQAPTFAAAIGAHLEAARDEQSKTTEDIARTARGLGLTWHRTTVRQTERGNRALTAAELLLLPLIYGKPLRDLLPTGQQTVWLTDETAVYGRELGRVLDEGYNPGTDSTFAPGAWHARHLGERLRKTGEAFASAFSRLRAALPRNAITAHVANPDEAETKAAKRLDTTPEYVAYSARELWGRGLAAERDARLAERGDAPTSSRAIQAARGHVTRALLAELEPAIREHEKQRGKPSDGFERVRDEDGVVRFVRVRAEDAD